MNWGNLKSNLCPECANTLKLEGGILFGYAYCAECKFRISVQRLDQLLQKMALRKRNHDQFEKDNSSELNNFGREEVAEDFSDSKFL